MQRIAQLEVEPASTTFARGSWSSAVPVVAALVMAFVFTLDGYSFGRNNQMEHLPAIQRLMDESLFARDYFIKSFIEGGPRVYYLRLLALAGQVMPLGPVFFLLTLASNAATLLITFRVTLQAFNLVAAYASLILLCTLQFYVRLGGAGFLLTDYLTPATLGIAGAFAAIGAAATGSGPVRAMLYALLTAVVHPSYGLFAGTAVAFVSALGPLRALRVSAPNRKRLLGVVALLGAFGAAFLLLWYRKEQPTVRLDDETFFHIFSRVRLPHHTRPSTFPWQDWALFANFSACSLCFLLAARHRMRTAMQPLLWLAALTMLGFVLGYVFVEVVPVRIVLMLEPYRFVCFTSWVGIVLAAGALGVLVEDWRMGALRASRATLVALGFTLLLLGELLIGSQRRGLTLVVFVVLALGAWAAHAQQRRVVAVATLAFVAAFLGLRLGVFAERGSWLGNLRPSFLLEDLETRYDDVADFARANSAPNDVFMIADAPKSLNAGTFRYKANRALFADVKVFPFRDDEIKEWYARVSALRALRPAANNDSQMLQLASRYGLAYAVVPNAMPSKLPVVFTGKTYRVLALRPTVAQSG